ncbi:hypothetical protein U0070_021230, partial [Myodes glareolus]
VQVRPRPTTFLHWAQASSGYRLGPGPQLFFTGPRTLQGTGLGLLRVWVRPRPTTFLHWARASSGYRVWVRPRLTTFLHWGRASSWYWLGSRPQLFFSGPGPHQCTGSAQANNFSSLGLGYFRVWVTPRPTTFLHLAQASSGPTTFLRWALASSEYRLGPGPQLFFTWPRPLQGYRLGPGPQLFFTGPGPLQGTG